MLLELTRDLRPSPALLARRSSTALRRCLRLGLGVARRPLRRRQRPLRRRRRRPLLRRPLDWRGGVGRGGGGGESPAIRLAANALPAAGLDGVPQAGTAGLGGFGGMPMMGGVVNASRNGAAEPRPESRLKVIPQLAAAPGARQGTPDGGMTPTGRAAGDALSDRERYELHTLRNEIAELAKQRDKAARLIKEAIRR